MKIMSLPIQAEIEMGILFIKLLVIDLQSQKQK